MGTMCLKGDRIQETEYRSNGSESLSEVEDLQFLILNSVFCLLNSSYPRPWVGASIDDNVSWKTGDPKVE